MKMKFNVIAMMMCGVMALSLMTGCGGSEAAAVHTDDNIQTEVVQQEEIPVADSTDIGEKKIKEVILDKVPGAVESSIYEFEREIDDGRVQYEGSLYHDGYEYEFEIDGATGNILQWEIDD